MEITPTNQPIGWSNFERVTRISKSKMSNWSSDFPDFSGCFRWAIGEFPQFAVCTTIPWTSRISANDVFSLSHHFLKLHREFFIWLTTATGGLQDAKKIKKWKSHLEKSLWSDEYINYSQGEGVSKNPVSPWMSDVNGSPGMMYIVVLLFLRS